MESSSHSLLPLGITDLLDQKNVLGLKEKPVLVGGGTDGASVNIAQQNGMRGMMQNGPSLAYVVLVLCPQTRVIV